MSNGAYRFKPLRSCAGQPHCNRCRSDGRGTTWARAEQRRASERDHGAVRVISMNRPEKLNALNTGLLVALRDALAAADQDESVRALVLTGEGRGFSAGADLSEFRGEQTPETLKRNALRSSLMSGLQVTLRTLSKPIVAAVHGAAIGGGAAFAICCDMVVVGTNLKLGSGIQASPDADRCDHQPAQAGRPEAAFEMISLGATFTADDVMRLGLANRAGAGRRAADRDRDRKGMVRERSPSARRDQEHVLQDAGAEVSKRGLALGKDVPPRCGQGLRRGNNSDRRGARKCALSPCGRGHVGLSPQLLWARGCPKH